MAADAAISISHPGLTGAQIHDGHSREALAALFDTHKDRVYSIAYRFTGDGAAAMDIAQDVFLKLIARKADCRAKASFDSWLYRVVVNGCLDHHRRSRRWLPLLDDLAEALPFWRTPAPSQNALENLLQQESASQVRKSVASLPASLRIIVVLRYSEGLAYDEIAKIIAVPPGTVASRLNRAHKLLEKRLLTRSLQDRRKTHV